MKIRLLSLLAAIALAFVSLTGVGRAGTGPSTPPARLEAFLQSYIQGQIGSPTDKDTRYSAAFVDLNGDGQKEAVVYLSGREWCGSGGCTMLILSPRKNSYRLVTKVTITRTPIRLLNTTSHGWRDIGVFVQGGGIHPGYEAALSFGGKSYPRNPSVLPARPLTKATGHLLIGPDDAGQPLYH